MAITSWQVGSCPWVRPIQAAAVTSSTGMTSKHLRIVQLSLNLTCLIRSIEHILPHLWMWRWHRLRIIIYSKRCLIILIVRVWTTLTVAGLLLIKIKGLSLLASHLLANCSSGRHRNILRLHSIVAWNSRASHLLISCNIASCTCFFCQKCSTVTIGYGILLLLVSVGGVWAHVTILAARLLSWCCLHYFWFQISCDEWRFCLQNSIYYKFEYIIVCLKAS